MNRLFLATNNGDVSGGEMMLFAVAEAARDLGWEVHVVAPRTPDEVCREADRRGFRVRRLAADTRPAYMLRLARFAAARPRDLFWCNGLVPSVALVAHRRRIVHLHQIPKGTHRILAALVLRSRAPRLVPSRYAAERLPGTQAFPNWVPEAVSGPAPERTERTGRLRVGYLGRLSTYKGLPTLLDAVADLLAAGADLELHVAGEYGYLEDADRARVEAAARRVPPERITWHGRVRPAEFLPRTDVLVVPSQIQEIFGLVAAEAMSARVPVVASDDGALPEVLGPGHPWIFPAGDSAALAAALQDLRRWREERPRQLDQVLDAARRRWAEQFSPDAGLERVAAVLGPFDRSDSPAPAPLPQED